MAIPWSPRTSVFAPRSDCSLWWRRFQLESVRNNYAALA
jgi:hypothetical protein